MLINVSKTKFEDSAEILHRVLNSKTGNLILTTRLSERFFIGRMGLAMASQCAFVALANLRYINALNNNNVPNLKSLGSPVTKL